MTNDEMNREILDVLGWKWQKGTEPTYGGTNIPRGWINPKTKRCQLTTPDFAHDLNAMHEAEKTLTIPQWEDYGHEICRVQRSGTTGVNDIHSTAAQRCEAFLRTIDKWKE